MNHHASKRRQIALRFFTYGVMTVAVIAISVICILLVLGYRFDQTSGQIERRSLLQFRSTPSGAAIEMDGQRLSFNTPGRRTVEAGEHTVAMRLEGYRDWSKTFTVTPGSISWLNYARFVPNTITTDDVRSFPQLTDMKPSPDRRWLAMIGKPADSEVIIADVRDEEQPKFSSIKLSRKVLNLKEGQNPGKLTIAEWDFGSRYILLKHEIDDRVDFIRVDRSDENATRNISRMMNVRIEKAHFSGTSGNVFFALVNGDVRKIDLGNETITGPLVRSVKDFMLYRSDMVAFTATRDGRNTAGVYKDGSDPVVVRSFDDDQPLRAAVSSYFGDDYLAIAHGPEIEIIKNPREDSDVAGRVFASFTFDPGAKWLQFASSGRFVVAQHGNTFKIYDLEEDKEFTTTLAENEGEITSRLRWLDDFYLWTDVGGSFRMSEFDGANQNVITEVAPGFGATLSENGERLFTIGREGDKFVLQSTRMIIE